MNENDPAPAPGRPADIRHGQQRRQQTVKSGQQDRRQDGEAVRRVRDPGGFVPLSESGRSARGGAQRGRTEKEREKYDRSVRHSNEAMRSKVKEGTPPGSAVNEDSEKRVKKNRNSGIIVICVFVAAAVVTLSLLVYNLVKVSDIVVEQSTVYDAAKVEEASGIVRGDKLLSVRRRAKEISAVIEKELPLIGSVEVDFDFPDTIRLIVTETSEKCVFVIGQHYVWTDDGGKVI